MKKSQFYLVIFKKFDKKSLNKAKNIRINICIKRPDKIFIIIHVGVRTSEYVVYLSTDIFVPFLPQIKYFFYYFQPNIWN